MRELTIAEQFEQSSPPLWAKCYPRRYQPTGNYASPKAPAQCMFEGIVRYVNGGLSSEEVEALWAAVLIKYKVPTFYLTKELSEALLLTVPPQVIEWPVMKLPFDGAVFMVPKGLINHLDGGDVSFISYARAYKDSTVAMVSPAGEKWQLYNCADSFNVVVRVSTGSTLHWTLDDQKTRYINLKQAKELAELVGNCPAHESAWAMSKFDAKDNVVMERSIRLLFNALMLMSLKPEMIRQASLIKRIQRKGQPVLEYWNPHYIGLNYKLKHEASPYQGGHHASPRAHWVCGFWREQAIGIARKQHKTIWVEPFFKPCSDGG